MTEEMIMNALNDLSVTTIKLESLDCNYQDITTLFDWTENAAKVPVYAKILEGDIDIIETTCMGVGIIQEISYWKKKIWLDIALVCQEKFVSMISNPTDQLAPYEVHIDENKELLRPRLYIIFSNKNEDRI